MGTHYFNRLDSGESIIKIYEMTCLSTDEKRKKEDRRLELVKEKLDREKNEQDQLKEKYLREGYEKAKKEIEEEAEGPIIRSLSDQLWHEKIQKLDKIRYRISIDDERILDEILHKYY
jgi:hypothetical protein